MAAKKTSADMVKVTKLLLEGQQKIGMAELELLHGNSGIDSKVREAKEVVEVALARVREHTVAQAS